MGKRLDLAIRILACENTKDRDTERKLIGALVAGLAGEKLRRHVARRPGRTLERNVLHVRQPRDPKIDELETGRVMLADCLQDDVLRLDVAMNNAGPVQGRNSLGQLDRIIKAGDRRQWWWAQQPDFQSFAFVERHHRVEAGPSIGGEFERFAYERVVHAGCNPCLAQKGRAQQVFSRSYGL